VEGEEGVIHKDKRGSKKRRVTKESLMGDAEKNWGNGHLKKSVIVQMNTALEYVSAAVDKRGLSREEVCA